MMRFTPSRPRRTFHQPPGRENARAQKEYATVTATLANRTEGAILLAREDLAVPVWVPRHALDSRGTIAAERSALKTEITIGVEVNMALSKGLV